MTEDVVHGVGTVVELVGVAVIVVGLLRATAIYLMRLRREPADTGYRQYRRLLGRPILLGLEFLIAGDIIRTVALDPNLESVAVLAIIVAIRTFISFELELEMEGRWPWQRDQGQG